MKLNWIEDQNLDPLHNIYGAAAAVLFPFPPPVMQSSSAHHSDCQTISPGRPPADAPGHCRPHLVIRLHRECLPPEQSSPFISTLTPMQSFQLDQLDQTHWARHWQGSQRQGLQRQGSVVLTKNLKFRVFCINTECLEKKRFKFETTYFDSIFRKRNQQPAQELQQKRSG